MPTFRGATNRTGDGYDMSVGAPAGVIPGDFQVVAVHLANDTEDVTNSPNGWTKLGQWSTYGDNVTQLIVYMSTTSTSQLSLTKDGSRPWSISRAAYANHGGYRAGSIKQAGPAGWNIGIPTQTTTTLGAMVIAGSIADPGEDRGDVPTCSIAGWTQRVRGCTDADEWQSDVIADMTQNAMFTANGVVEWGWTAGLVTQSWSLVLDGGTPTISPSGLASALTFGTAKVVTGQVWVAPAGLASSLAFGYPGVGTAQAITGVGGIPSSQAFGGAEFGAGATYVRTSGIASGFAFGAPRLTPGLVTITVGTGIASAGVFGDARIGYGFATTDLPRAYPRTEIPYPAVAYEVVCVARIPQQTGAPLLIEVDPIDWVSLSYTDELSKPQDFSATAKVDNLTVEVKQRLQKLDELGTEVWLYRQGKLVFAGPILGWQRQGDSVTISAGGLLSYLRYWFVTADLVYAGVDQNLIVKGLIDHWQDQDFGNFGLDTSSITACGTVRDATYLQKELHPIGKRVEELGLRQNGFDIEVDPTTRKVRIWNPMQGVDRSVGEDAIVFDERNITSDSALCSAAPGDLASEAFGTGTAADQTIWATKSNTNLRASFGRIGVAETYDGVTEQTTLDAHTQGLVDARSQTLIVPGPDVRTTVDADLDSYDVGDTVSYHVDEALGVVGAFRLRKRTVSATAVGREKTAIEFV